LTGNIAGLITVLSSRLSHTELRISLREPHSFYSAHADTIMASSPGNQPSKMNTSEVTLALIEGYRPLPELWDTENRHYSNRLKKAAAYDDSLVFIHHSHMQKKTHRTDKKTDKPDGKPVLCQRKFSSVFRAVFFKQLNCTV
jgi:hypothetical protein